MTANVLHRPDCVRGTCWPGPPLVGMLIYSTVVTLYLAYLGFAGRLTGTFLWPAVALHLILSTFSVGLGSLLRCLAGAGRHVGCQSCD
jgi:hypothetical protein